MLWTRLPNRKGYKRRESFPIQSSHHQTLLGKALFEHGDPELVAAVASSSSSIRNSSLGPNLLSLIQVNNQSVLHLFSEVFLDRSSSSSSSSASTLQFTYALYIHSLDEPSMIVDNLIRHLASPDHCRYFSKSLQSVTVVQDPDSLPLVFPHFFLPFSQENKNTSPPKATIVTSFPSLRKLVLDGECATDEVCTKFIHRTNFPVVEHLELSWSDHLTDIGLEVVVSSKKSSSLSTLLHLELQGCDRVEGSGFENIHLPQLKILKISSSDSFSDSGLDFIAAAGEGGLPNLSELDLRHSDLVGDGGVFGIASSFPHLQKLNLFGCKGVSDAGIQAIVSGLANLTSLHVGYSPITNVGAQEITSNLVNLTYLRLSDLPEVQFATAFENHQLTKLQNFKVYCTRDFFGGLSLPFKNLLPQTLTHLRLCEVDDVNDDELLFIPSQFPNLVVLELECELITDVLVKALCNKKISKVDKLERLKVMSRHVTDESFKFLASSESKLVSTLTELDFSSCYALSDAGIKYLARQSQFPKLKRLLLNCNCKLTAPICVLTFCAAYESFPLLEYLDLDCPGGVYDHLAIRKFEKAFPFAKISV